MKYIYTTLLLSAAMTIASNADAQSKQNAPVAPRLLAAGTHAHVVATDLRGGGGPVNDNCGDVTFEALANGASLTFTGDNTGSTEDGDFEAGSGLEGFGPVVWHGFTTTECANLTLTYCGQNPAWQNLAAFLARTCPATDADYVTYTAGNFDDCGDGNATITFENVEAGSYYLPVLRDDSASAVGAYSIGLAAASCVNAPANDDCAGAIALSVTSDCTFTEFSSQSATESQAADSCNGYLGDANDDIWFSFVATATDMTIAAQGAGDETTGYDAVIQVFDGSCGSLTALGCEDSTLNAGIESVDLTGLTVGNTYLARVFHYYTAGPGDYNVGMCVTESGPIGFEELNGEEFGLFPNPGTGVFNLQYAGKSGLSNIEVFDVAGRVVYNAQVQLARGTTHSMDLTGLSTGSYNVRLTVGGVRTEQRLMVK